MSNQRQSDLARGAQALGVALNDNQQDQLLALIALLAKWNRAYNLTAITEPDQMLRKHVLDSLSVQSFISGERIADVGTGAGFPGLPLAIVNPQRNFTLVDSHAKKLRFVDQAAAELGLTNVTSVHVRAEDYSPTAPFDVVVCRAFTSLSRFIGWCAHLLAPGGSAIAMKGHLDEQELLAVDAAWQVESTPVVVPLVSEVRHIVQMTRR